MQYANDYNDNRVHIDETQSNQAYYCPYCGAPMITKKGDIRQHHFAHSSSHHCSDSWERTHTYDTSIWHNVWQSTFPKINQEVKLSLGETKHRADVLIDRTVVEFQHSIMQVKAFDDRNNFYSNLGYKVVWLFDLSEIYSQGKIRYFEKDNGFVFVWDNPKRVFNSYDVKNGCIDLFFQLSEEASEEAIVRVLDVSERGVEQFYASKFISKEAFLRYVGLQDGQCAPPLRYDVEQNRIYTEFCQKYNIVLNKQQERAVQAVEGSNLLLAVPGSGKTTVLVARLGHMVFNRGIDPDSILAITFNRKAAIEMKERFNRMFESNLKGSSIHFSTINALCYSVYRHYCRTKHIAEKNLIEGNERRKVLIDILSKYSEEYPSENEILDFEQALSYIKNMMLNDAGLLEWNSSYPNIRVMYQDYQKALKDSGHMDFDDQMVFALAILNRESELLSAFKNKYKYIAVDEAQDTSKIQHTIIQKIAEGGNLFMVGDEDQSIYGFRGAYPKALLNFRYDYINPYILRMQQNYRSTPQIVEKAQLFISKNKGRYEKNMTAERDPGDAVKCICVNNREEQYLYLLNIAKELTKQTAFLYRDNESSVVLFDLLLREDIPFIYKTPEMNYFGTRVILDIIAYLRLAINDRDFESLKRVCNKGILFLKKKQLDCAINDCKYSKLGVFDALDKQMKYVKEEYKTRAADFKSFVESVASSTPFNAIDFILKSGYGKYMEKKHLDYGKVELLLILAKKEATIESFLNRLQFLEKQIKKGFNDGFQNSITLSTIHSSKGLEYDTVYMVDVYDGRFPSSRPNTFNRSKDSASGEQEERRLFYVGITRAKNNLYLFSIAQKYSSYVEELFPEIEKHRKEKKRILIETGQNREYETWHQQQMEWKEKTVRKQVENETHKKELEERRQIREEERERQKALEDPRCPDEILKIIDQQDYKALDALGRRWVRCKKCGVIKQAECFPSYGGLNRVNLGICSVCARKS